jgi:hypothetical protein
MVSGGSVVPRIWRSADLSSRAKRGILVAGPKPFPGEIPRFARDDRLHSDRLAGAPRASRARCGPTIRKHGEGAETRVLTAS